MANWLNFEKMNEWEHAVFVGFSYDFVTDEMIKKALANEELMSKVDVNGDWEDNSELADRISDLKMSEGAFHAFRIAGLVKALRNGEKLREAPNLDTFNKNCCSCVSNGHHRVRALQYLGLTAGPFDLSGMERELLDLVDVAGTEPMEEAKKYVDEKLFSKKGNLQKRGVRKSKM